MANQNFRVKHGLEVSGNTSVSGITTLGSLDTGSGQITQLSGTNISISGIASLPTLDTTIGEINYLSGVHLDYSGIASVTKVEATNASIGVATITTLDVTSGTIDILSGTNANVSGVITATSFYGNLIGNVTGDLTGNADTSTNLSTPRDFSVSGDVATESAISFDGSDNVNLAVSLSNNFKANTSGIITAAQLSTGEEGSAIRVTSDTISGPSIINIDPSGIGDNTGLVVIKGDLQIDGTQTVVNSTAVTVDDKNIILGSGAENDAAADGGGITLESGDGNKTLNWVDSTNSWTSSENFDLASDNVYKIGGTEVLSSTLLTIANVNASGVITATTFEGNLTGNVDGIADKASELLTPRSFSVDGDVATASAVSFNGTGDVALSVQLSNTFSADTTGIIAATRFSSDQLNVTGIATISQLELGGFSPDGSDYGIVNYIPVANGTGGWSWQPIAAAGGGSLDGVTILEEGSAVGAAGSVISINFVGNNVTATANGTAATITLSDNPSFGNVSLSGIITASSFVKSGGTSSEFLKADGTVDTNTYLTSYTETDTLDLVTGRGNTTSNGISVGILTVSNQIKIESSDSNPARIDLFCEVGNIHYTRLQAAPHSEYSGNAVVNLPAINGDIIVGNTDVAINKNINTIGVITASSIVKSGGTSSEFLKADGSVDSSTYLTSYTETDTLNSVTGRGNSTSNGISVGVLTASSIGINSTSTSALINLYSTGTFIDCNGPAFPGGSNKFTVNGDGSCSMSGNLSAVSAYLGEGGEVYLYYFADERFRTTNGGINVTGTTDTDQLVTNLLSVSGISTFSQSINVNGGLYFGSGSSIDFQSALSFFNSNEDAYITLNSLGGVVLYYSDSTRLQTIGAGVTITGTTFTNQLSASGIITATSFSGSGSNLTNIPLDSDFTSNGFMKRTGAGTYTVDTNTYLTSYTETDTLNSVTGRGNTTSNGISVGFLTATSASIIGVVTATDFNSSSDINLKDNVRLIEDPIAKVMSIRGVNFEWKETSETSAGIIAQEVEKIMPELVKDTGDKKTVNYNGLIGLLIEVVKEQQKQIDELRGKL